jgi:hypothetical protein
MEANQFLMILNSPLSIHEEVRYKLEKPTTYYKSSTSRLAPSNQVFPEVTNCETPLASLIVELSTQ